MIDDIISYYGHSLEQYKHCDILDVNSGAGLWSSKLHDFLQPRRHVLLEPDNFYDRFLQPLINAPNSKYVRGPAVQSVMSTLAGVLERPHEILPEQHAFEQGDPRLNQPNTSLLLVVNLSRTRGKNFRSAYFLTREILDLLTASAWTHTGIHRYGQVRMLAWMGEYYKARLMPRELNDVDSYGLSFQYRTDTRIVADNPGPRLHREGTSLDLASAVRVADKMRASGIKIPTNRQSLLHQTALSMLDTADVASIQAELQAEITTPQESDVEKKELEDAFKSGTHKAPKKTALKSEREQNPRWERLEELKRTTDAWQRNRRMVFAAVKPFLLQADRIHQLEYIVIDENRPAQERLAAKEEMDKLKAGLKRSVPRIASNRIKTYYNTLDNRRAFYRNPSLLDWDNRALEPLLTQPNEFYPQQSLALLDVTPKPAPRELSRQDLSYFQRFTDKIYDRPASSIVKALNSLCSGSADTILREVRLVHDPHQGGSLDLEDLRVRALSPEMIDEIVNAWRNWTFRPDVLEKVLTELRMEWDDLLDGADITKLF